MAELSEIIQDIHDNIHTNGQNGITGQLLQTTLDGMAVGLSEQVSQLGQYVNGQNNYPGILPLEILKPEYCRVFKGFWGILNDALKLYTGDGRNHVVCRVTPGQVISLTSADSSHRISVYLFSSYYNEDNGDISKIILTSDEGKYFTANASTVTFTVPLDTYYLAFNIYSNYTYPSKVVINGNDVTDSFLKIIGNYNETIEERFNQAWENGKSVSYLTGKKVDSTSNVKLSGFIPVVNNCVAEIYSECNTTGNYGFALYRTANEDSFVAAKILKIYSQSSYAATIFIPKEANYIRLTYHSSRNTNPRVEYDEYTQDEKIIGAVPVKFSEGIRGTMGSSFVVGATNKTPDVEPDADYRFATIECAANEAYTINGYGTGKVYCIVDAGDTVLAVGTTRVINETVIIPTGGKYLYINTLKDAPLSYKGSTPNGNITVWQGDEEQFDLLESYPNDRIFLTNSSRILATDNDNVVKKAVRDFMKVDYNDDLVNYSHSEAGYFSKPDCPRPILVQVSIPNRTDLYANSKFKLYDEDDNLVYSETITEGIYKKTLKIWNLEPSKTYHWTLKNSSENTLFSQGAVTPQGYPRFVMVMPSGIVNRVENVRDLGGWPIGVDKRVKYGLVFRGSDMNWGHYINQDGINVMLNDLHISYDMDLRSPSEYSPFLEESPLGNSVEWGNFPVTAYLISGTYGTQFANAINQIADNIENGLVTYFHCKEGADRTGTLSLLILGLLGVSENDLSKEYELTNDRYRNHLESDERDIPHLISSIKSYTGATLKDKIETWALSAGVTQSSIDTIRGAMIVCKNL